MFFLLHEPSQEDESVANIFFRQGAPVNHCFSHNESINVFKLSLDKAEVRIGEEIGTKEAVNLLEVFLKFREIELQLAQATFLLPSQMCSNAKLLSQSLIEIEKKDRMRELVKTQFILHELAQITLILREDVMKEIQTRQVKFDPASEGVISTHIPFNGCVKVRLGRFSKRNTNLELLEKHRTQHKGLLGGILLRVGKKLVIIAAVATT
jgi:hypothetical protein